MNRNLSLCLALVLLSIVNTFAQTAANTMPRIIEKDGGHALLVDGKPFLMLGGQAHNSSAWPGMMPNVWRAAAAMHLNTLEVPIYWEQVEPEPGKFDFSVVNTLISQARQHKVHLVLLWFATWKNGSNHYMPEWMKRDAAKYPNVTNQKGQPVDSPSPNVKATLDADIKAFTAVMRYLKTTDPQHTVLMVQVENESGAWGSIRDYSPLAQKMFEGQVPAALMTPGVLGALNVPVVSSGTWQQVFGDRADEYFQAWSVARFIGQVAAAGKAVYPLPLYVNAALREPFGNPTANNYESGGPTDNVIPIWKVAAPAIDIEAPDLYLNSSDKVLKVLDLYGRRDNPLFVPEAGLIAENAKYFYTVLAHGGIGFSPFGIDDNGVAEKDALMTERLSPFAQEYAAAAPMMRQLAEWAFEGRVKAVVEREDHAEQTIDLGAWQADVKFGGDGRANAAPVYNQATGNLLLAKLAENQFIVMGTRCHLSFQPLGANAGKAWQYLKVEEGRYENGTFKSLRILNGDETDWGGPGFGNMPTVLRISLVVR
ncbi:DUF5597 domain-containing protein [uncultured Mucilaginibacter sp.]|uniref:GH35 family beta-galactosidase n=1 Tax=uncultured Mucilaginibacter sp. TaxID=797541 RepID=UPI0025D3E598|nr:DUF5597 domain-containing protein [uncultured Mucilaginibacter sp.]